MSDDADALRAQLAALAAERDAAVARAAAAEGAAASALRRVASLERLLLASDSGGGAHLHDDHHGDVIAAHAGDGDSDGGAETAHAAAPLQAGATWPGDLERQFGDAAAEPPAPAGANPFAAGFDPAQEARRHQNQ